MVIALLNDHQLSLKKASSCCVHFTQFYYINIFSLRLPPNPPFHNTFQIMSTFLAAIFLIFGLVGSTSTETLDKLLLDKTCGFQFPPRNVIPNSCKVEPPGDVELTDSTVEVYLCLALLDIKSSICALKNGASFENLEKIRLNGHAENDDKFCERMTKLNSSSANVKKLYENLKNKCYICFAVDKEVDKLRRAMCETLYHGHEILTQLRKAVPNNENHPSAFKPETNPLRSSFPSLSPLHQSLHTVDGLHLQPVQSFNSSKTIDKKGQESLTGGETAHGKSDSSNLVNDGKGNLPTAIGKVGESYPGQNSENSPPQDQPASKLITKKNQTVDSGVEEHVDELDIRNPDVPSQQGQSKQSTISKSDAGQGESMKISDPHTPNMAKPVGPETKKGSDGHVQDGVYESVPDKGDMNEAVDTPITNMGEDVEEVDDENIQEANHLQGETDDDDDDVGIGDKDKDKRIKANQNPKGTAQQSTKTDDLSKLSNANPASGRTYGYSTFVEAEDSHFFAYFMSLSAFFIICYLAYHNKRKIIAMAVEGKKNRNTGRRRPNSASYHKLDSNLEEAMSSNVTSTNSYVIY